MTDANYTAIAVLMDRSGSMASIRTDAEGALHAFITAQLELPGRCTIRLSDFDTTYRTVYPSTSLDRAPYYELKPRGGTALLDGIGRLVSEFGAELAAMDEPARPAHVLVVVQTDGEENASKEWTREQIFALITEQQNRYSWSFVFLGANQDAIAAGSQLGFSPGSSITYAATATGVANSGLSLSGYTTRLRGGPSGQSASFTSEERLAAVATDD